MPQTAYGAPPAAPLSAFAPPPAAYPPPGSASPYAAAGIAGFGLSQLLTGVAGRSVFFGVLGIAVPVATFFFAGGTVFFFYALPIFGLIYGVRALMKGLVIGGVVGIVLNVVAGLISIGIAIASNG